MLRFLKNLTIGISLVFVLDLIFGKILETAYFKVEAGPYRERTYAFNNSNEDILIFGSSRASHHYDPEIIGQALNGTVFNTGSDGHYIFYQTALLKAILKRYKPKHVIYDFYGSFCNDKNDYDRLSILLPYYQSHQEIREIVHLRGPFEPLKNFSRLYPYNSTTAKIALGFFREDTHANGYVPLKQPFENMAKIEFREPCKLDENKIKVFIEFLRLCKEQNISLTVFFSPVLFENSDDFSLKTCKAICAQENVDFYDFSNESKILNKEKYFSDEIHLNQLGAEIFSKEVSEKIKTKKIINKTRN